MNRIKIHKNFTCGYCNFHKRDLHVEELERKNCLSKDNNKGLTCRHLIRFNNHWYWKERGKRFGIDATKGRYSKYIHK